MNQCWKFGTKSKITNV